LKEWLAMTVDENQTRNQAKLKRHTTTSSLVVARLARSLPVSSQDWR
jgi:hypothetical protein